jgi:hypothetical protein
MWRERERERERDILLCVNGEEGENQHAINREYQPSTATVKHIIIFVNNNLISRVIINFISSINLWQHC